MEDQDRGIHELWPEPWEGLPEEEEAWTWEEEAREKDGRTTDPPHDRGKWYRWYFVYHALEDHEHHPLKIRERWVKASDGRWYTRMVGMV